MASERVHDEQPIIGDAFGEALLACRAGGGGPGVAYELIERSDGYLAASDAAQYFGPADEWAVAAATGRVVDIGAGAGRVALPLQAGGHDVVALDVSKGATTVCRERGMRSTFTGTVFDLAATGPEPFDTFVMVGNNLALLGGPQAAPAYLDTLARMARPGARIVGETLNPYSTTDPEHIAYHEANRRLGRLGGQLRLRIRHQRLTTPWFDYLFCTPEELAAVVAPTPWELVEAQAASRETPRPWKAVLSLRSS